MIRFVEGESPKLSAGIKVIGVGGCGSNAVDRMISLSIPNVDFIACNTDLQALNQNQAPLKVQIGQNSTRGLGAGGDPERGREAALEDLEKLRATLSGADMAFITAGMGGGTGTGAAPIIANLARECGALTVAVVTKPFRFEGRKRQEQAEKGLQNLKGHADTLLIIPNDKLLVAAKPTTTIQEAFKMADDVLSQAVRGISDLITIPGYINLDFADVRKIMSNMGVCLMGTGIATGEDRAIQAVRAAISSPLLDDLSIDGAKGILINITGGKDLTLREINEASTFIFEAADREANIIWGYVIDENLDGKIKITVIATGFASRHESVPRQEVRDPIIEIREQPEVIEEEEPTVSVTPVEFKTSEPEIEDYQEVETAVEEAFEVQLEEPIYEPQQAVYHNVDMEPIPPYRRRKLVVHEPQTFEKFGDNYYFETSNQLFPSVVTRLPEDIPQPETE